MLRDTLFSLLFFSVPEREGKVFQVDHKKKNYENALSNFKKEIMQIGMVSTIPFSSVPGPF